MFYNRKGWSAVQWTRNLFALRWDWLCYLLLFRNCFFLDHTVARLMLCGELRVWMSSCIEVCENFSRWPVYGRGPTKRRWPCVCLASQRTRLLPCLSGVGVRVIFVKRPPALSLFCNPLASELWMNDVSARSCVRQLLFFVVGWRDREPCASRWRIFACDRFIAIGIAVSKYLWLIQSWP